MVGAVRPLLGKQNTTARDARKSGEYNQQLCGVTS